MGSGVSVVEKSGSDATVGDMETFKALQSAYESSKELDDLDLFNLLAKVYETSKEDNNQSAITLTDKGIVVREEQAEQVETIEKKEETPEDKEAKKERNMSFIIACGAFHKGNARADIGKAQKLFEDGVDVNYVDNDG
jgi:hypothetical protein